jgi:hypothetical protein
MFGTVFIGVEDIYVPEQKRELMEILKPMITGDWGELRRMNTDQVMQDICCNFMFNSNHRDAVQKTADGRRLAIFFTPQQAIGDIKRDGMDGPYFPNLYSWLNAGGYAIVSGLLHNYAIADEFNPAGACQRAPDTSSTGAAIAHSLGRVEQEIMESVEQGRPGFAGGWISSVMLSLLLKDINARIPHNKRKDMLATLGYHHHPGLPDGRVFNDVLPDGAKPRLFVRAGHESSSLVGGAVARAYSDAQTLQQPALRSVG